MNCRRAVCSHQKTSAGCRTRLPLGRRRRADADAKAPTPTRQAGADAAGVAALRRPAALLARVAAAAPSERHTDDAFNHKQINQIGKNNIYKIHIYKHIGREAQYIKSMSSD
ncbi:uncharacterized protein LOC120625882 [Pararge aegeria]|uniref:uncharacterized protein LOC120625882 n=1 Tax=Pararge aegeria TaxID=116150 RepID=UPI0019D02090|nr:uncharacterized protein LOC120625882 [Pararge aegeria]